MEGSYTRHISVRAGWIAPTRLSPMRDAGLPSGSARALTCWRLRRLSRVANFSHRRASRRGAAMGTRGACAPQIRWRHIELS